MPFFFIDTSGPKPPSSSALYDNLKLSPIASTQQARGDHNPSEWFIKQSIKGYQSNAKASQYKLKQGLTASDIMSSPVITLSHLQTLESAQLIISKYDFRHIPIIDARGLVVGLVSDRDILHCLNRHERLSVKEFKQLPIQSIMSKEVLTITEDTDVREAAEIMANESIGSLPVIEENPYQIGPKLTGIITKSNLYTLIIEATVIDSMV